MATFYYALFYIHITAGLIAMVLFWVPLATRKGGFNHRSFGRYYRRSMYLVAYCGILMSLLMFTVPTWIKPELAALDSSSAQITSVRVFATLLVFLGWLTLFSVYHGQVSLQAKQNRSAYRTPRYLTLLAGMFILGLICLVAGIQYGHPLLQIFGGLGLFSSISTYRLIRKKEVSNKLWLTEHLGGYIGSGIAAYTAFLTFGARHLIQLDGYWQLTFWVLPGVIGGISIALLTRKYAKNAKLVQL
jgi:magnesium-transporting ATPase (P-type)